MKHPILKVLALAALLAISATASFAQASNGSWFKIPFDFVVDGRSLPAGEYYVENLWHTAVAFNATKDHPGLIVLSRSMEQQKSIATAKLVFHRYPDQNVLSRVELRNTDYARNFPSTSVTHVIKVGGQISQVKPTVVVIYGK